MIQILNDNKFFLGIMMILLNIGSRHLVDEISTNPEEYDRNILLRRVAIFAVCFVGTRDVVVATILTAAYIILAQGISRKSREGMRNKETFNEQKTEKYTTKAVSNDEPLFTSL